MVANVESMFSVREVPWHGRGTIVEDKLTAREAIVAAGLDWDVELRPVYVTKQSGIMFSQVKDRFAVVRTSDQQVFDIVGKNYRPLQNRDAFQLFDNLVDDGAAKYETAGSLASGKEVWLTAEMPDTIFIGDVDPIKTYLLLANRHDGKGAVRVAVTPVRVVCQNTLNLAMQEAQRSFSVRHVTGMEANLLQARETLGLTFKYMEAFTKQANDLLFPVSPELFTRYQDKLVDELDMSDKLATNFKAKTLALFTDGVTTESVRGTGWAAVNTVSEYYEYFRPGNKSTDDAALRRSLDTGSGAAKARQTATDLMVAIRP